MRAKIPGWVLTHSVLASMHCCDVVLSSVHVCLTALASSMAPVEGLGASLVKRLDEEVEEDKEEAESVSAATTTRSVLVCDFVFLSSSSALGATADGVIILVVCDLVTELTTSAAVVVVGFALVVAVSSLSPNSCRAYTAGIFRTKQVGNCSLYVPVLVSKARTPTRWLDNCWF